jgi:hypothetical protein
MENDLDRDRNYCSFLLRLKQIRTDDLQTWVVSVHNTHTGRQQIFSNVDGLIQFLLAEFGNDQQQNAPGASVTNGMPDVRMQ